MQKENTGKYHYIYKITRNDGKYYIGMHSTNTLEDGYFGSGTLIINSIKKHGLERHHKEILEFCQSRAELKIRERQYVNNELIADPNCMNLQLGGGGGFISKEHQIKCASAGGKANGAKIAWFRHRAKMSKAVSDELKRRHVNGLVNYRGMLGKKHTETTKNKMRESASGENNSQFGSFWVTDGIKPVKIKKEFLDEYLTKGYSRGRRIIPE